MGKPRVLILEDSIFMREKLKDLIVKAGGAIVGEAADGGEGIKLFKTMEPDIVFVDIVMPNVSGMEALDEMMEIDNTVKFVICTSIAEDNLRKNSLKKGVTDYISKPFKDEEITKIIRRYS